MVEERQAVAVAAHLSIRSETVAGKARDSHWRGRELSFLFRGEHGEPDSSARAERHDGRGDQLSAHDRTDYVRHVRRRVHSGSWDFEPEVDYRRGSAFVQRNLRLVRGV